MSSKARTRPWLLAVAVGALALLLALGWMTFPRSTGSDTPDADLVDAVERDAAAVLWSGENDGLPEPETMERVRRIVTQLQWDAADVRPLADALRAWTVTPADLDDATTLERKARQAGALVVAVGLEGDIHPALAQATADVMASWLAHLHGAVRLSDDGGPSLDVDTGGQRANRARWSWDHDSGPARSQASGASSMRSRHSGQRTRGSRAGWPPPTSGGSHPRSPRCCNPTVDR